MKNVDLEPFVELARQGDKEALETIVYETIPALRTYVSLRFIDKNVVEDVIQESYLRIYHKLDKYKKGTNFRAFTMTVTKYVVLEFKKKAAVQKRILDKYSEEVIQTHDTLSQQWLQSNPTNLENKLDKLRICKEKLPPQMKKLIQLYYDKSMSVAKISETIQKKVSAINVSLHRARKALADCAKN